MRLKPFARTIPFFSFKQLLMFLCLLPVMSVLIRLHIVSCERLVSLTIKFVFYIRRKKKGLNLLTTTAGAQLAFSKSSTKSAVLTKTAGQNANATVLDRCCVFFSRLLFLLLLSSHVFTGAFLLFFAVVTAQCTGASNLYIDSTNYANFVNCTVRN
jgi:hypothetical protein